MPLGGDEVLPHPPLTPEGENRAPPCFLVGVEEQTSHEGTTDLMVGQMLLPSDGEEVSSSLLGLL